MTIIQKNLCLTLIEDQQNLRWIEIIHLRFEKCAFTILWLLISIGVSPETPNQKQCPTTITMDY